MPEKSLSEAQLQQLIADIKKKKELIALTSTFVHDQLHSMLSKNKKLARQLQQNFHPKSSAYKEIIKVVRSQLRRVYGLYREVEDLKKRKNLLESLKRIPRFSLAKRKVVIEAILNTSASTKERLQFYPRFYEKIFKIVEENSKEKLKIEKERIEKEGITKPVTFLDLGAGIHPFSLSLVPLHTLTYLAYDLSNDEVLLLQDFFDFLHKENHSFHGKAEVFDVLQFESLLNLPKADIALLLKVTDVLDRGKGHKVSEYVISKVPAEFVVVSFSTVTISGKKMNFPRRRWIEWMCARLEYTFESFTLGNEFFYVIEKKI